MFANDPRDYSRAGQRQGHAGEPYHDADQSWQQQGQHAAQPGQGQQAAYGQPQGAQPGQAAPQGQEGWQTAGQEAPLHAAEAGQDDAVVAALQAEVEALKAQLAEAEQKAGENHEHFVRASAETENVRRRSKEELDKARKFAIEGFAESLLPVCDNTGNHLENLVRRHSRIGSKLLQTIIRCHYSQIIQPLLSQGQIGTLRLKQCFRIRTGNRRNFSHLVHHTHSQLSFQMPQQIRMHICIHFFTKDLLCALDGQ